MNAMLRTQTCTRQHHQARTRTGTVAGAVLRASRRSARASTTTLATSASVPKNTITAWENGSSPLASQLMPTLQGLTAALAALGADPHLTGDLDAAIWCDLIFTAIGQHEDIICLLAEPITNDRRFRDLLSWTLGGQIPARYARYLPPASPITSKTLIDRTRHAITAAHPALAADCLPPPAPEPLWQREQTRHRRHLSWQDATRHCPAGQPRKPQRGVPWTCRRPGRRAKRAQ